MNYDYIFSFRCIYFVIALNWQEKLSWFNYARFSIILQSTSFPLWSHTLGFEKKFKIYKMHYLSWGHFWLKSFEATQRKFM